MPVLAPNQPVTLDVPVLLVENRLTAGRHRFALVVRNARGVASEPHVVVVTIGRVRPPAAPPAAPPIDPPPPRRPRRPPR